MNTDAFVNRELSWLEFNRRVLEEAQDPSVPLLERVKFLAIFSSNLDEFFMVRVATLKRRIRAGDQAPGPDGLTPAETLAAVAARVHELVDEQHRCFLEEIQPLLAAEGIVLLRPKETSEEQQRFLEDYFRRTLLPVLTPLAVDPGHPVPVPRQPLALPRGLHPAVGALGAAAQRALRHPHPEPGAAALRRAARRRRQARLHAARGRDPPAPAEPLQRLRHPVEPRHPRHARRGSCSRRAARRICSPASRRACASGASARPCGCSTTPTCRPTSWPRSSTSSSCRPRTSTRARASRPSRTCSSSTRRSTCPGSRTGRCRRIPSRAFERAPDIWSAIRARDVLVHHPYHTFDAVTRFVREAAVDPKVLAIKMTLYRVSPASPIAHALRTAVENGKEVAVLVELQARFDEEANIRWARALEEVGAHVVYGLAGFKTHCKACLVVRQEADGIRRYCHLATGNYNVRTGGVYERPRALHQPRVVRRGPHRAVQPAHRLHAPARLPPPAARARAICATGSSSASAARPSHARAGRPARIIAKMNGLVDRRLIEELYAASEAGVRIDLIVRGICCLRPEVPGLSENIRVISIVDRYLEHARIFYFENAGDPEYLLASADWMPRNLDRRVEIAFPVLDPDLQAQIREILEIQLADTVKARRILADGSSVRIVAARAPALRSQERLYEAMATKALPRT